MDNPAADSLMETVRNINRIAQGGSSGELDADDYLRVLGSDPVTEWFTGLLREKNAELARETERSDRLAGALRAWSREAREEKGNGSGGEATLRLVKVLREMGIEP